MVVVYGCVRVRLPILYTKMYEDLVLDCIWYGVVTRYCTVMIAGSVASISQNVYPYVTRLTEAMLLPPERKAHR